MALGCRHRCECWQRRDELSELADVAAVAVAPAWSTQADRLAQELQKIYDSEIDVTVRTAGKRILVGLGNDLPGFSRKSGQVRIHPRLVEPGV